MVRANLDTRRKGVLVVSALLGLFVLCGWIFYYFGLDAFLEAAYNGHSLDYFNDFAARWRYRQTAPTYQAFVTEARSILFRLALLGTVIASIVIGGLLWVPRRVAHFFSAETSPYNLALLRTLTFGTLLLFDLGNPAAYARLPAALQFPPTGIDPILSFIPLSGEAITVASLLFRGACISGLLGFYSRTSAAIATVTGTYLLGIPQLYGKTIHYHHVIWFAGLMAASPAGAVLSVDSVLRAWRSPSEEISEKAEAYARPIRFGWLLIGIIYFFPGFWKFASEGLTWALSENLKYRMYTLWFSYETFRPLFRLDMYPVLYQGAALATMAFEICFVFTLPFGFLRPWAAGGALLFHQATDWFLNIYFWSLPPFLLSLFDVRGGAKRLGRALGRPLNVTYHNHAAWQCRVVAVLARFDLFDRLRFATSSQGDPSLAVSGTAPPAIWLNGRLSVRGIMRLLHRAPTVLPLLPIAFLVPGLRSTNPANTTPKNARKRSFSHWPVTIVGSVLFSMNVLCGLGHVHSWPFSVYPTFAVRSDSVVHTIRVRAIDSSGQSLEILSPTSDPSSVGLSVPRLRGLTHSILQMSDSKERTAKLRALWRVYSERAASTRNTKEVRFYRVEHSMSPPFESSQPISETLIATISV